MHAEAREISAVAVLGDVVRSKQHADRDDLQRELRRALELANDSALAVDPLTQTIGDEFQGLYRNVASALHATLLIRLSLHGRVDVRFGIGWGPLTTYDEDRAPFEQDGPAWWAAREAIERVRTMSQRREMPRGLRSMFLTPGSLDEEGAVAADAQAPAHVEGLVNAYLLCRDELVASMSARDAETMRYLLEGESPTRIAERQGLTLSAVSQRAIRAGLYALREAQRSIEEAFR
ncbi:MAG: SatD family protein [Actinomycetota bacterium]